MRAGIDTPLAVLRTILPTLCGVTILDVGCGEGRLAADLAAAGALVTGVDPSASALDRARALAPAATFVCAGAEALPFPAASFDAVVIVNALHHVPASIMDLALSEASRVVRPDGTIVVIEPLAEGSFFEALRPVEDEGAVRAAAQAALGRAAATGMVRLRKTMTYTRRDLFRSADDFLERIVAVDPARAAVVSAGRAGLRAHVEAVAGRNGAEQIRLDQPIKVDILSVGRARQPLPVAHGGRPPAARRPPAQRGS
jgi:ubiquinone/menaquinone biosynthesis C-methylase UbiE